MKHLLEVQNLRVSYDTYAGKIQAVRGIEFSVDAGKTTAIVGESGCGKTVTVKSIMGLIDEPGVIEKGSRILFDGREMENLSEKEWNCFRGKDCAMIFQDALAALNPTMQIGKQIAENLRNHHAGMSGEEMKKRTKEILEHLGIPDAAGCMKRYPHELSGGMRQRVMIAAAVINRPRLLIADEPTTSLDVTIQAQILALMKKLQKETGMAILLITHDLGIVAEIAHDIVVMYAGKIVEKGSLRQIFYHTRHPYTWALIHSVPERNLRRKTKLATIEGNIPDMTHVPTGCAFCARCPYAMEICRQYEPPETNLEHGHVVFCWLMHEQADTRDIPFLQGA